MSACFVASVHAGATAGAIYTDVPIGECITVAVFGTAAVSINAHWVTDDCCSSVCAVRIGAAFALTRVTVAYGVGSAAVAIIDAAVNTDATVFITLHVGATG